MPVFDPSYIPNLAFWFEPRLGGLYQDSAGTATVATANDDPVGYMPDQSGNGFHATETTATTSRRPLLKTAGFNGLPCIRFDGSNDMLGLGNPAALSGASRGGYTVTYCLSLVTSTAYGTLLSRGTEDVDIWDWIGDEVYAGTTQPISCNWTFRFSGRQAQTGALTTATRYIITHRVTPTLAPVSTTFNTMQHEWFINGQLVSTAPMSNHAAGTNWVLGARSDPAFYSNIDLAGVTFFGRSLLDEELDQVHGYFAVPYNVPIGKSALRTYYQRLNGPLNIIHEGNSIACGARAIECYQSKCHELIKYDYTEHQLALDGRVTATSTSTVSTRLKSAIEPNKLNIVVLFEISNELNAGTSAATAYANVIAYCNAAKAVDPNLKIIVLTPVSRNFGANQVAYEANRQTVNASLRADSAPVWDYLLDVGNSTTISVFGTSVDVSAIGAAGAYSSTTYFADGVHVNRAGNMIIANALSLAINGMVKQYLEPYATIKNNQLAIMGLV